MLRNIGLFVISVILCLPSLSFGEDKAIGPLLQRLSVNVYCSTGSGNTQGSGTLIKDVVDQIELNPGVSLNPLRRIVLKIL